MIDPNNESAVLSQLQNFIFVSVISADNEKIPEEEKQEILTRFSDQQSKQVPMYDWEYILEPISDIDIRNKYINDLESTDTL